MPIEDAVEAPLAASESVTPARSLVWLRLQKREVQRPLINAAALFIIGGVVQVITGKFYTVGNIENIFVEIAVVAVIVCAESLVMVAGAIDVSVSGVVVLTGIVSGLLAQHMALWLAFVLATLTGAFCGLVTSFLVLGVGITSLIATIGMLYVTEGVANLLTNGLPVVNLPSSYATVGSGRIGGVPWAMPMVFFVLIVFVAIQRYTILGRNAIAVGSNSNGAFLNGVNVRRTMTLCFVLCGTAAGWAGIVYASRIGNPESTLDNDLLFQVIVACVVGGTSLLGGQGTVFGAFLGAMLIATINNALDLLGINLFWQDISLGALLVIAVGLDTGLRNFRHSPLWKMFRSVRQPR